MGIQTRLLKARYSEYNIKLSYKDTHLKTNKNFFVTHRNLVQDTVDKALKQVLYPVCKDRYYKHNHQKITDDYIKYCYHSKRTNTTLIMAKLILPLVHYIRNKHLYYNTYEYIGITITTSIVHQMRKSVMKQMILKQELPNIWDRASARSNSYYPLYKPMLNKTTAVMRDNLYSISIDLAMKYIEYHKLDM